MPWGCPKLCVCPVCSSRRETELRKRVEELEALAAKLEAALRAVAPEVLAAMEGTP